MFNKKVRENTGLKCPITGSNLIYTGDESAFIMHGDSFYEAESDSKIQYSKNTSSVFYNLRGTDRWFRFKDHNWTEYFEVQTVDFISMFPIGTSQSEIDEIIEKRKIGRDERINLYNKRVASGEITAGPVLTQISANSINVDEVTISPMDLPKMELNYFNKNMSIKKFEVITNWLVQFEIGTIVQFDGKEYYRVDGDQTDRKIHKDIVEAIPLWFKEIK